MDKSMANQLKKSSQKYAEHRFVKQTHAKNQPVIKDAATAALATAAFAGTVYAGKLLYDSLKGRFGNKEQQQKDIKAKEEAQLRGGFKQGGRVKKSGKYLVHKKEYVVKKGKKITKKQKKKVSRRKK